MKTLTVNTESATVLLQCILEKELYLLQCNIEDNVYESQEKQLVIEEMDIIVNLLEQLG